MASFDVGAGYRALKVTSPGITGVYLIVVVGIIAHWVWAVLVAGLPTGTFDFGPPSVWVARIVIAFIAGAFSITGIFNQVKDADPTIRSFLAFTLGFAVDALTGPVVSTAAGSPTGAG